MFALNVVLMRASLYRLTSDDPDEQENDCYNKEDM
jgi:hypothetical protein